MHMDMHAKHQLTLQILPRYLSADKQSKTKILDEYCANTGYDRKYAIVKLKTFQFSEGIADHMPGKHRRRRERIYDGAVEATLQTIWEAYDGICAERIHPNLATMINKLVSCNELVIDPIVEYKLQAISLGTLKRLLKHIREHERNRIGGGTKPGTLTKHEIPLRVGTWNEHDPGYLELDLVAQCGDSGAGMFANTLNTTDIATGWFEAEAVMGKAQIRVHAGIKHIRERLPFSLLGIDSDNGSEFINWEMVRYCRKEHIVFTRSRPYKKNDNAHIEQKNWVCIRKILGYMRIERQFQVNLMNRLYRGPLRDYINFFLPSARCIKRKRIGSRILKVYDNARTPYERLCDHPGISVETKTALQRRYDELNPVELRRQIAMLKKKIFRE